MSKYTSIPPISQGEDKNGCWAASFAWWLKAVLNKNYSFYDVLEMYAKWVSYPEDTEAKDFGALKEQGVKVMFNDPRFPICGQPMLQEKLSSGMVTNLLKTSPILIAYYEPSVDGFHMNVLIELKNSDNLSEGIVVMDPSFETFQTRTLDYYRRYEKALYIGFQISMVGAENSYAYQ